jgi:hypothetical protein
MNRQQLESEIESVVKSYNTNRREALEKAFNGGNNAALLKMARSIRKGLPKGGSILEQFVSDGQEPVSFDAAASGPGNLYDHRETSSASLSAALMSQYPTWTEMHSIARPTPEPSPWDLPPGSGLEARANHPTGILDPGPKQSIPASLGMPDLSPQKALKAAIAELATPVYAYGWTEATAIDDPTAVAYKHTDFPGHLITIDYSAGSWNHSYYGNDVANGKDAATLNNWLAELKATDGQLDSKKVGISRLHKSASAPEAKAISILKSHKIEMDGVHKAHLSHVTGLGKAHAASITGASTLAAAKSMAKSHLNQMLSAHGAHLAKVMGLEKAYKGAMLNCMQ